jgi:MYXO-CTERM domain-containing protein
MRSLTHLPPPGPKGGTRVARGWLLATLLAAPLTAGAGFAHDDRSFDNRSDVEHMSQQSFELLSAVGDEPTFPWAGNDVVATEPEWQYTLGTSLMPSAIPEPQAAAMWLVGLVAFGFIARRRSSG